MAIPTLTIQPHWQARGIRLLQLTLGAIATAFSVLVFLAPSNIAPAGVSGVAVILNHLIGSPISLVIFLGNIPIQIMAYRILGGKGVVLATVYFIAVYTVALELMSPLISQEGVSENLLLNALFGGIVGGIGNGLIYRAGGTSGGTSTIARILQEFWGTPMSSTYLYTDTGIILLSGLVFGWEAALYAIVALFIDGMTSDYILEGPSVVRTATIITDHPQEVSQIIMQEMRRGVTGWEATGMFTNNPHTVLFISIARPQVNELKFLVHSVDPHAFIVIGQAHTAYGEGFRQVRR